MIRTVNASATNPTAMQWFTLMRAQILNDVILAIVDTNQQIQGIMRQPVHSIVRQVQGIEGEREERGQFPQLARLANKLGQLPSRFSNTPGLRTGRYSTAFLAAWDVDSNSRTSFDLALEINKMKR